MNSVGLQGEVIASNFLNKKGYKILERNFRIRNGEIDIIAIDTKTDPQTLVFIEVKTRTGHAYGTPLESITSYKLKFLMRTAQFYSTTHPKLSQNLRIDAVSVYLGEEGEVLDIEHVENISQ